MKKLFLTLLLGTTMLLSFGQSNEKVKPYYNEFGVDATSFLRQFFNFNQQYSNSYSPVYYLTYRRHFKHGNIRSAIGGNYSKRDVLPSIQTDLNSYHYNSYSLYARVGWEFTNDLSKRWQVFYGLDFRPSFDSYKNDEENSNYDWATGRERKYTVYALAPLLGFKFKLTDRLSISTEASFLMYWQQEENRQYYTPIAAQPQNPPPRPIPAEVTSPTLKSVGSNFFQPLFILITFDI